MIQERRRLETLDERTQFEARFARSLGLVRFVASRLLNDVEEIEEAVEKCYQTASGYPMKFLFEGEFRRWLVTIAADEASGIQSRRFFHIMKSFDQQLNNG